MTYKDYFGSVNFSEEDEVFHGKIEFIKALITYEGTDVKSLKKAFHEAVDDYLEICEAQGRKPEKIFKGSFNIRIKPEIHRQISIMAAEKTLMLINLFQIFWKHLLKTAQIYHHKPLFRKTLHFMILIINCPHY
jgi:predicted HicB family RNase H-like nuclease